MRPEQLDLLVSVTGLDAHPCGDWAIAAVSRPDFTTDSYVGQLFTVPADGSGPRRLTRGQHDSSPQLSPDGTLVAFLRGVDGPPQLHVVEVSGGEPVQLTDRKLGVGQFTWSPDGTHLAFISREPEPGRYGTVDDISARQEAPRHFTGNKLQANGMGWINGRPAQLFLIALPDLNAEPALKPQGWAAFTAKQQTPTPEPATNPLVPVATKLTKDEVNWSNPTFTPDGSAVVVVGSAHRDAENDLLADLYSVTIRGAKPKKLTNTSRRASHLDADVPVFSTDGQWLFFGGSDLGPTGQDFVGNHASVYVMPAAGGEPTRLTDREIAVTSSLRPYGPDGVLFTDDFHGRSRVVAVTSTGEVTILFDQPAVASQAVAGGNRVFAAVATATSQDDVALITDGQATALTDFSAPLREHTQVVEPTELIATAPDGYPVQGWVLIPPGQGPHPVLLHIHGGPYAAYHASYFDEFQVAVQAGYAVVACNPRGAMGFGSEHGRSIKDDMGNLDMVDILAFLDQAIEQNPALDGQRVGIMGGSYGGYMTAWIIAHDHRFAGAIVERGFLDGLSFVGASDIGWFFPGEYQGHDDAAMNRQSPMLLTDQVKTPTLVIHSEQDLRCPLDQGLNYYARLKKAGVDAEIVIFPGENHELTRSGTPWHRRQRFEKVLEFWATHLPVDGARARRAAKGHQAGIASTAGATAIPASQGAPATVGAAAKTAHSATELAKPAKKGKGKKGKKSAKATKDQAGKAKDRKKS